MPSVTAQSQFYDLVDEGKAHQQDIVLWPARWKKHRKQASDPKVWQIFPFERISARKIPRKPGVYAFLIKPALPVGLDHGILIYIGKADSSIRDRYMSYLKQAADPLQGRPVVAVWLHKYRGYLHFAFAEMSSTAKPAAYEERLLNALTPAVNRQFPTEIRRIISAF